MSDVKCALMLIEASKRDVKAMSDVMELTPHVRVAL